jgi:hypothetical protein
MERLYGTYSPYIYKIQDMHTRTSTYLTTASDPDWIQGISRTLLQAFIL